mmetsp:Transcript_26937/g.74270  ORF Transcript_26937/g.74270 Transcript_26937/m.74270 type:complete len:227 (-) Transcript_26937:1419-2099(-)
MPSTSQDVAAVAKDPQGSWVDSVALGLDDDNNDDDDSSEEIDYNSDEARIPDTFAASTRNSSMLESCLKKTATMHRRPKPLHNVSFCDRVSVREFNVTMGDHPYNTDGMALTLDWSHSLEDAVLDLESYSRVRTAKFALPRRLSYGERRERLFRPPPLSQNNNLELSNSIWMLQRSILQKKNQAVPPSPLNILQDEKDQALYEKLKRKQSKVIQPPPMEIEWKRIL